MGLHRNFNLQNPRQPRPNSPKNIGLVELTGLQDKLLSRFELKTEFEKISIAKLFVILYINVTDIYIYIVFTARITNLTSSQNC